MYKKLLWDELHGPHYEASALSSEEIFSKHTASSAQIDCPCAQAHIYLYGILKMHTAKIGMRWIAGNHMQAINGPAEQGNHKKMPACSLSALETTMGGILRMCMHVLESKDKACRQKGYKRYWVVTNVDRVAADIKHNTKKLQGQPVFTRDFACMYTSIPQEKLQDRVKQAVTEVFNWHSNKAGIPFNDLRPDVAYDSNNVPQPSSLKKASLSLKFLIRFVKCVLKFIFSNTTLERFADTFVVSLWEANVLLNLHIYTAMQSKLNILILC